MLGTAHGGYRRSRHALSPRAEWPALKSAHTLSHGNHRAAYVSKRARARECEGEGGGQMKKLCTAVLVRHLETTLKGTHWLRAPIWNGVFVKMTNLLHPWPASLLNDSTILPSIWARYCNIFNAFFGFVVIRLLTRHVFVSLNRQLKIASKTFSYAQKIYFTGCVRNWYSLGAYRK